MVKQVNEIHDTFGYEPIPGYTRYLINRDGSVIDTKTGRYKNTIVTTPSKSSITGGYRLYRLRNDHGRIRTIGRHRLMMITFKHPGVDVSKLVVNHLDGVPGNDTLDNLEWCTYSQNTKHAYDNNLHPDKVVAIVAWHVPTGSFECFSTLEKAAAATGFNPIALRRRTKPPRNSRYYDDGWLFKENDGTDWPDIENTIYTSTGAKLILARNIRTLETTLHENKLRAAEFFDLEPGNLGHHARHKSIHPLEGYWFREVETAVDDVKFPVFTEFDLLRYSEGYMVTSPYPVLIYPDGSEIKYISYKAAGEAIGKSEITVRRMCRTGRSSDGIRVRSETREFQYT